MILVESDLGVHPDAIDWYRLDRKTFKTFNRFYETKVISSNGSPEHRFSGSSLKFVH